MTARPYSILFLCTHNSARSVMAECLLNDISAGRFVAYSAGSAPSGKINPLVADLLARSGYDTARLHSKSWAAFEGPDAPPLDFVITLCDDAAGEACPVWPGRPLSAHWPFPDPNACQGSEAERRAFVADVFRQIGNRLRIFVNLPIDSLDRMSLQRRIREMTGDSAGAVTN